MREYRITGRELARLGVRRFSVLLRGLSPDALFPQLVEKTPKRIDDPSEAAALMARA